jgi:hypothetical protein
MKDIKDYDLIREVLLKTPIRKIDSIAKIKRNSSGKLFY